MPLKADLFIVRLHPGVQQRRREVSEFTIKDSRYICLLEKRIEELEAECKRLKEELRDSWEHSWRCKHKSNTTGACICGLKEALNE